MDCPRHAIAILLARYLDNCIEAEAILDSATFDTHDDAGMGGYYIVHPKLKESSKAAIEARFLDQNQEGIITLYVDANGLPTEVDVWKFDFSPVSELPGRNNIFDIRRLSS